MSAPKADLPDALWAKIFAELEGRIRADLRLMELEPYCTAEAHCEIQQLRLVCRKFNDLIKDHPRLSKCLVPVVTVSEFIDSISHLSLGKKAALKTHVQSQEFGASLDAECDMIFLEALQGCLPATLNAMERTRLKQALMRLELVDVEINEVPVRDFKKSRSLHGQLFVGGIRKTVASRGLVLLGIGDGGIPSDKEGWTNRIFPTTPVKLVVGPKPGRQSATVVLERGDSPPVTQKLKNMTSRMDGCNENNPLHFPTPECLEPLWQAIMS